METPGEPGTGPLGAPYPASFASGHLEREKLVKLEGQPRWGGVEGGEPELGLSQGKGGGDGWAKPCSGLVPPPPPSPPGQPRPRGTMCLVPAGCKQVDRSGRGAP